MTYSARVTITDDTGFAERVNSLPKYVASRTLEDPLDWNTSLIKADLADSVASLKRQHRGNLISFGCGELAYQVATQGLADEIHFWVNPAVWGTGDRAFHGRQVRMAQIAPTAFDSGITLLCYRPAPDEPPPQVGADLRFQVHSVALVDLCRTECVARLRPGADAASRASTSS